MNIKSRKYKQVIKVKERLESILKRFSKKRKKKSPHEKIISTATEPLIKSSLLAINKIISNKLSDAEISLCLECAIKRAKMAMERLSALKKKYQKFSNFYEDLRIDMVVIYHILWEILPKGYLVQFSLLAPEEYTDENYEEPILETVKKTLDYWCAVINTCWETTKGVVKSFFKTRWDVFVEKNKTNLPWKTFEGEQLRLSFQAI